MPVRTVVRHFESTVLFCLLLVPFCAAHEWNHDWDYEETHDQAHDFAAGGTVHVHMGVGDLHIKRGDSDHIRLHYTVKSRRERNIKNAQVEFEVHGTEADLELHGTTSGNTQFDVELEVPAKTNLDIHEKVGDLTVDEIEGNKDLELGVGDIRVARENSIYRMVRASTGIGDVSGNGYGESSGWLGKTLKYHGDGQYELRARVSVGDITLGDK